MRSEGREMENKDLNILTDESVVKMAQEGSNTAYEFLIKKYKELAKNKAKIYYIAGGDKEDVIQEGMIGIFKAIRDFDDTKETSFSTFAELCVNHQIINAIKSANRQKHKILNESVSLSAVGGEEGDPVPLWEKLASEPASNPETLMLMKEITEFLKAEGSRLFSPFEKKVWSEMLQGKNYKEIAVKYHRSAKAVDNAMQRIRKKIRNFMEE